MSRKLVTLPYSVLTNGDMSTASLTTDVVPIQYGDSVGFQLVWTGSPTGTFDVQGSLDQVTWTSITLSASISAAGSGDHALIDMFALSFPWIRVVYTKGSGTGTLNVLATVKNLSS